ncbi:hypothetical protein A6R68_17569 [Neotoma lepida]|uniref:Uncharacterized protein n=1 Tax=Neotoma lepida TaxID=56216 RepID=A0A1A6HCH0_NEOLE|nr:hypothetical protein A6R68_17569 [Neotoma lepida]
MVTAALQNTSKILIFGAETSQALPAAGLSYACLGPCARVLLYPQLPLFSFAQLPNCSAHTLVAPKCTLSDTSSQTPKPRTPKQQRTTHHPRTPWLLQKPDSPSLPLRTLTPIKSAGSSSWETRRPHSCLPAFF